MIFGILLILVGCLIAAPAASGAATDFHLFAALNIIGLGAICCTVAHHLSAIRNELKARSHEPAKKQARAPREYRRDEVMMSPPPSARFRN